MNKTSNLYCAWADAGIALHNSGRCLLCCHSQTYLQDTDKQELYLDTNSLEEAWNSPTRKQIQDALSADVQHPNCSACWNEENAGRQSRRQVANQQFANMEANPARPKLVDLKPGNTCNLACRTCWPEVSSKWYRDYWELEAHKQEPDYKKYLASWGRIKSSYDQDNQELWSELQEWLGDIEYYDIYGAEPMLLTRVFDILQHAVDTGLASTQSLHINTNGTIWNPKYIDILTKFKHVALDISIDGIGPHFDYIRYGETWSTVEKNLDRYQELVRNNHNISMNICVTVCAYNIWYLDEIQQYFVDRKIGSFFNMVHHPEHINVRVLPDSVKAQVREKLKSAGPQIASVLDFMDMPLNNQTELWAKFWETTKKLDLLRQQDLALTFPEFYQLISSSHP
jgi:sulfatase maturation enzyme AslB (radical SAM superfamily)